MEGNILGRTEELGVSSLGDFESGAVRDGVAVDDC